MTSNFAVASRVNNGQVTDDATRPSTNAPFLKWLGGKRWLIPAIERKLPKTHFERYFEPFLGGGAAFFRFGITPAVLSDINGPLINTYIQVRDEPDEVLRKLRAIKVDAETFYRIRRMKPTSPIGRAVRFLYLNRTAFNGIYRVNRRGEFNVPYGARVKSTEILWKDNLLRNASEALQETELCQSDFEISLNRAGRNDLVYCDPTYVTMHNNNGFRKYNETCFSWVDQKRLAQACNRAVQRGATVVVSNAYHHDIRPLYERFDALVVERTSILASDSLKRKLTQEYVFFAKGRDGGEASRAGGGK